MGELGELLVIVKESAANFNAIADGEKAIETEVSITNQSLMMLALILVVTFVLIFGIAKVMKPFK